MSSRSTTPASASVRRARPLLGTFVEITASGGAHPAALEAAVEQAFEAVSTVHRLMSFHRPGSDLDRLNREAGQRAVPVHPWTWQVLEAALDLHRRSAGVFDIAVAPVLEELGLLPRSLACAEDAQPALSRTGAVELGAGHRVRFLQPGTRIDLGGIAKGFAVDRAMKVLRRGGVTRGLVNAGGDLASFGQHPFSVHVRDPRDASRWMCRVALQEGALASSGCSGPFGNADVAPSAVIDPGTGRPVHAVHGATVRAPTCMVADALTKVVMIAGEAAFPVLAHYGADAMFLPAAGDLCLTRGWRDTVRLAA